MKNHYFLISFILFFNTAFGQTINFPDANFKAKLLQPNVALDLFQQSITLDANGDGEIEVSEVQNVVFIVISNSNISDLTGISNFTSLRDLVCDHNQLTSIDIDDTIALRYLKANNNADFAQCTFRF